MRWPKTCRQLHCLPFFLHLFDEGAVWSGSTLFAISFASLGWGSSLIRVYTVCHFICIFWMKEQSDQGLHCLLFCLHILWMKEQSDQGLFAVRFAQLVDEGAVWSESTPFAILCASFEGRSLQGLHCLPFRLHLLDEGAVWSGSALFAILLDAFFCGKVFKFYENYRIFFKSECLEFLWKVIVSQCCYPLNYGGFIF